MPASPPAVARKQSGSIAKGKMREIIPVDSTKIHLVKSEAAYDRHTATLKPDKEVYQDRLEENGKNSRVPWAQLERSLQGSFYHRQQQTKEFNYYSTVFNAACTSPSLALVCVANAEDVSTIIKFANEYDLTISVKSGGYNAAGWAIQGDIVIDCSKLTTLSIILPGQSRPMQGDAKLLSKRPRISTAYTQNLDPYPPRAIPGSSTDRAVEQRSGTSSSSGESPFTTSESKTSPSSATSPEVEESAAKRQRSDPARASNQTQNWVDSQYTSQGPSSTTFFMPVPPANGGISSDPSNELFHPSPAGMATSSSAAFSSTSLLGSNFASFFNPYSSSGPDPSSFSFTGQMQEALADAHQVTRLSPPAASPPLSATPPGGRPFATVSLGAGVAVRQIDEFTAPHGYYVPLSAYPVGSASLHTGGFGFLSRKHGLSIDNLIGMEIVLADGEIVWLCDPDSPEFSMKSEEEQKKQNDLWWMARGAATTVGIVTRMEMKAHPVGQVYGADMIFPFNPATASSLLKHWRDCMKDVPNDLFSSCILTAGPTPTSHVIVITVCCLGPSTSALDASVGENFTAAICSWQGETALLKSIETRTFLEQQDTNAKVLKCDADMRWTVRSSLCPSLSDEMIHETIVRFTQMPQRTVWLFEAAGGAIGQMGEETCFPEVNRKALFQVAAIHQWRGESEDVKEKNAAQDWINGVICPDDSETGCGPYPCFIDCDEGSDRIAATFGENWDRMLKIKQNYDPENVFKFNFFPSDGKMRGKRVATKGYVGSVPVVA